MLSLLLLLAGGCTCGYRSFYTGTVVDSATQAPLPDASVYGFFVDSYVLEPGSISWLDPVSPDPSGAFEVEVLALSDAPKTVSLEGRSVPLRFTCGGYAERIINVTGGKHGSKTDIGPISLTAVP